MLTAMSISGIRAHAEYQANNSISETELRRLEEASRRVEQERQELDNARQPRSEDGIIVEARQNQTFGSGEYADTYQPGQTYEMKGAESDLGSLDVQKAVSDMQKDRIIQQYQFFVGHGVLGMEQKLPTDPVMDVEDFLLE